MENRLRNQKGTTITVQHLFGQWTVTEFVSFRLSSFPTGPLGFFKWADVVCGVVCGSFLDIGIQKRTTRSGHRVVQFRVTSINIPLWIGSTVENRVRYKHSIPGITRGCDQGESHDRRKTVPFPCRVQFVSNEKKNLSPLELILEWY